MSPAPQISNNFPACQLINLQMFAHWKILQILKRLKKEEKTNQDINLKQINQFQPFDQLLVMHVQFSNVFSDVSDTTVKDKFYRIRMHFLSGTPADRRQQVPFVALTTEFVKIWFQTPTWMLVCQCVSANYNRMPTKTKCICKPKTVTLNV